MAKADDGAKRRILVVGTGSLLDNAIGGLLQNAGGFQVLSLDYTNPSSLAEAITTIKPDTIILSQSEALTPTEVFELLNNTPTSPALRLVVVYTDTNTIDLYHKKRITITHRDDLLTMIDGDV